MEKSLKGAYKGRCKAPPFRLQKVADPAFLGIFFI
jgi:hypothetical protein